MPTLDSGGWAHFGDEVLGPDQRRDPRIWGTQGNLNDNLGVFDQRRQVDPSLYVEQFVPGAGDNAPDRWSYTLKPEIAAQLGGRTQLGQLGAGGHAELKDPSQAEYDPRFGFLTKPENYSNADPRETGFNEAMSRAVQIGAIAAPAYFAGPEMFSNMFGDGAGSGAGWDGSFGAGGLAPEEAAAGLGDGLGSGSWAAGDAIDAAGTGFTDVPGQMSRLPPGQFTPMANSPFSSPWQQFLDNPMGTIGSRIASNPLGAMQFASGLGGALGGGSEGGGGGGSGDIGGTVDPFALNLGDYQPNQATSRQLADYGGFEQSLGGDMWNPYQSKQGYGQSQGMGGGQGYSQPNPWQSQQAQNPWQSQQADYGQSMYGQGMLGNPQAQQDNYGGGMLGAMPNMAKPAPFDGFGPRPPPQSTPNPAQPNDGFGPRPPPQSTPMPAQTGPAPTRGQEGWYGVGGMGNNAARQAVTTGADPSLRGNAAWMQQTLMQNGFAPGTEDYNAQQAQLLALSRNKGNRREDIVFTPGQSFSMRGR